MKLANSYTSFRRFRLEVLQLYQQGAYGQALRRIERSIQDFPDYESQILNWQIDLLALSQDIEAALRVFKQAIDKGYWYPVETLDNDEDLAALKGHPEFDRLAAICGERHSQAVLTARAKLERFEPLPGTPAPFPLLIAFHGRNANAGSSASYWQSLADKGWLVALPQSSQIIGQNSYCWDDRELGILEAQGHFEALIESYPVDRERVILGGFSQGAGMAIWMTIRRLLPATGFIAVSPFIAGHGLIADQATESPGRELRGYLLTGDQDQYQELFAEIERLLQASRVKYQRERLADLGHDYPVDFDARLTRALKFILGREPETDSE
jgi:dienelactone hydrolase